MNQVQNLLCFHVKDDGKDELTENLDGAILLYGHMGVLEMQVACFCCKVFTPHTANWVHNLTLCTT